MPAFMDEASPAGPPGCERGKRPRFPRAGRRRVGCDHRCVFDGGRMPVDDGPRVAIHHQGHIDEPRPRSGVVEVGDPIAVGRALGEVAVEQMGGSTSVLGAGNRGAVPLAPDHPGQASIAGPLAEPGVHLSCTGPSLMHRTLHKTRSGCGGVLLGERPGRRDERTAVAVAGCTDLFPGDQLSVLAGWPPPPPQ